MQVPYDSFHCKLVDLIVAYFECNVTDVKIFQLLQIFREHYDTAWPNKAITCLNPNLLTRSFLSLESPRAIAIMPSSSILLKCIDKSSSSVRYWEIFLAPSAVTKFEPESFSLYWCSTVEERSVLARGWKGIHQWSMTSQDTDWSVSWSLWSYPCCSQ